MQVIRRGLAVAALAGAAAVLVPTSISAQTTPAAWTIYVADGQANVVRPIDAGTLTVGAPITVGAAPQSLAITPDARTLYVANSAGGSVTPVDIATGTAAAPIVVPPGTDAGGLSIAPDGATAYVTHVGVSNGFVSPIDIANELVRHRHHHRRSDRRTGRHRGQP